MWQRVTVSATSKGGQQFLGLCLGRSGCRQCLYDLKPDEIIWYQHHARGRQYEKKTSKQYIQSSFKRFAKETIQPISGLSRKSWESTVTITGKTIAVKIMCRALRDRSLTL